ncbi:MAG: prolyl oligopeptidase family serine peptidase [Candidatus Longimicrobiales bacterium M2_2A_002]
MKRIFGAAVRLSAGALLAAGLWLAGTPAYAQQVAELEPPPAADQAFDLSIRSIMRGHELVGKDPERVTWTDDSQWIYFQWLPGGRAWHEDRQLYRVPAGGGEPELVADEVPDSLAPLLSGGDISDDRSRRVTAVRGDLYVVERATQSVRRLTDTGAREESPSFAATGDRVFYTRDGHLFALALDGGGITQLTDIRQGPEPPEDEEAEGREAFLEAQQEELFEHVRLQKEREAEREAREEEREADEPETVWLGETEQVRALSPNPAGTHVVVTAYTPAAASEQVMVPEWVNETGYTEGLDTRSKVGDAQGTTRVGLLEVATGAIAWLELVPDPAVRDPASADSLAEESGEPDLFGAAFVGWNDDGTLGLVQSIAYDFKTRWLWSLDAATGELTLLDELTDEAWVGGPCFSGSGGGCVGWIPDTDRVYFVSEATGWAHLWAVEADGSDRRQLTSGQWEVRDVSIPDGADRFHLHTSRTSPFDTHFHTLDFDGGALTQITTGDGEYSATPSPDGDRLALVVSRANRPPELFVAPFERASELEQVTVSPTETWLTFPWLEPEIIRFEADDGARVPAQIYRPADMGAEPNGAAVVFVHGAGYLQNVSHGWSGYFREYMFHHYLAAMGYTVLDIDYRGSAGYGRDWRTAIYRWMGGADLSDQVDGAGYLVAEEGIDPDRIGIYGGSYGGFITLMALFTAGDTFRAGAALRSVTDWAHYNHWYTSRILNQPQDDPEAYERSSPIYFAEGFGPDQHLLMLHGMVDTNVHFSDVVRLSQRLIELGKEDWELAVFPVEGHGFVAPDAWTDEYRRIFELMDRTVGERVTVEPPASGARSTSPGRWPGRGRTP